MFLSQPPLFLPCGLSEIALFFTLLVQQGSGGVQRAGKFSPTMGKKKVFVSRWCSFRFAYGSFWVGSRYPCARCGVSAHWAALGCVQVTQIIGWHQGFWYFIFSPPPFHIFPRLCLQMTFSWLVLHTQASFFPSLAAQLTWPRSAGIAGALLGLCRYAGGGCRRCEPSGGFARWQAAFRLWWVP